MKIRTKKDLDTWVYNTIVSNPRKFGGDDSNAYIMQEYSKQCHNGEIISSLDKSFFSAISTVSRIKNDLLLDNPHLDYREKNKPKHKKKMV